MTDEHALFRDLVSANRILANEGVLDSFGHVSVRDPQSRGHYFISRSLAPEWVTEADIQRLTLDGQRVGADERRSYAEVAIHGAIYRARPDVGAICHNHAPSVIPFSVTAEPLRPVFHIGSVIGPEVPTWDSADDFGATDMLVRTNEAGDSLARRLAQGRVALMRGHGSVVCGTTIRETVFTTVYLERNAELLLQARALGAPKTLSADEVRLAAEVHFQPSINERAWDNWLRRLPPRS